MSVTVGVEPQALVLEPGSRATVTVGVVNASDVVEHYETSVLGLPFGVSASSDPPTTKLRPGEHGTIKVTVELSSKPPPAATSTVLGVLVTSPYRQQVSRCEELRLQVTPISGLTARATPEVATGARASYRIEVTNPGNTPLMVSLAGQDAERLTELRFDPYELYVAPGSTAAAMVTAAARRPWTGTPARRHLALTARTPEVEATSTVTLIQKPRIHPTVLRVVGLVGGLSIMAGAMFGAARMATTMLNQGADKRDGNNTAIAAKASQQIAAESASQAIEVARQNRLAAEASQSAALASQLISASGAEKSALESSMRELNSQSLAAESLDVAKQSSAAASLASVSASAASASAASASVASASSASLQSLASASSASASSASAALNAMPSNRIELTVAPLNMAATTTGVIAAGAYPPLTLTPLPNEASSACRTVTTMNRMSHKSLGYFVAPGTIDTTTGKGKCLDTPVRIQFATPVRQVTVELLATGLTSGDALSTGQLSYSMQIEGPGGLVTGPSQVQQAGTTVPLGYTDPSGGATITAVRVRGTKSGTDVPLMVLQAVTYR